MTKVFVGNFSFAVDEEQLKSYFTKVGTVVSARVMKEGQGGRSRGFGFVEFSAPDEAERAIKELDGSVWEGRVIKVSEDRSARRHEHEPYHESGERSDEERQQRQSSPMGYFRAQPLDLGVRRRKKLDPFLEDTSLSIDYKDAKLLSRFMSERGRILPRRMTGLTAANQRRIARAIKRAQNIGLLAAVRK